MTHLDWNWGEEQRCCNYCGKEHNRLSEFCSTKCAVDWIAEDIRENMLAAWKQHRQVAKIQRFHQMYQAGPNKVK